VADYKPIQNASLLQVEPVTRLSAFGGLARLPVKK
jgi:hypothetical protein